MNSTIISHIFLKIYIKNDEAQILIQDIDPYTTPCSSFLDYVGKFRKVGEELPKNKKL